MADIVKLRASVFIGGVEWMPPITDPASGCQLEFAGDLRGFTPHAVNTGRSRVEQEVVVDFVKRKLRAFAGTGVSIIKITAPDGTVSNEQGHAPTDCIVVENEQWQEGYVSFTMKSSVSHPLRPHAPAPDYLLQVKVETNGTVHVQGSHDGFPCYEFYKQADFGPFELLYSHHYMDSGDTPAAMGGEMEYHFNISL